MRGMSSLVLGARPASANCLDLLCDPWCAQTFVRKVIELHDKFLDYVDDCFAKHSLFHKVRCGPCASTQLHFLF